MSIAQDSLVFYYDAINNVGSDTHDNNATVWKDLSGNGNDVNITGAVFGNKSLLFDGKDDWINCGQHNYANITLDVLVKFNTVGGASEEYNAVIGNWQSGGCGIQQKNGKNSFNINIGGTWYHLYGSDCVIGQKFHLTASYDGAIIKFYENGVLVSSTEKTGSIKSPTGSTVTSIGSNPNGSSIGITPLNGYVYFARLYSRALTDEEVLSNYNYDSERFVDEILYEHIIDFNDSKWTSRRPEVFTLTDGTTPFKVDSTFLYEEKPSYRSGAISSNGTSSSVMTFNLVEDGYVEFNYTVNSEGNYDWLRVLVDGTEVLKKSGTIAWTTFKHLMTAGTHTIEFKYTKDGSGNVGSDAGAIGYIKFVGVEKAFAKKYLICSDNKLYTVSEGNIVELSDNVISPDLFVNSGFDELEDFSIMLSLTNPELLYWQDSENDPLPMKILMNALPHPQSIITENIDLTHPTIVNIASVTGECEGSPMLSCEFNGVWKEHNGTEWVDEVSGMTLEALQAITPEQWDEMIAGLSEFRIKFVLDSADDKVIELNVNFNVDVTQAT